MEEEVVTTVEVGLIDIRLINEDPNQPRKHFDEDALKELAADIKQHGIIQPITVRPDKISRILAPKELSDKQCFRIVCGERRYRAAIIAGLSEVPCMVRHLSDEEAFEFQIAENLQRKNINPMEESDAFNALVSRGLKTAEEIADKLGVSTRYIYDRLILQKVVLEIQDGVRNGQISISQAKQFARLQPLDQQKFLEFIGDWNQWHVAEIREKINEQFNLKLANAPFNVTDKSLVKKAGACIKCAKRSGCNLLLFEEVEQEDVCFDAECWNTKTHAFIEQKIEALKKEGKKVVLLSGHWGSTDPNLKGRSFWQYNEAENESDVVGIVIEASQYQRELLGKVVNLKHIHPTDEDDDVEDDDNNEEVNNANSARTPHIDYQEMFMVEAAKSVLLGYAHNKPIFPPVDLVVLLQEKIVQEFCRLDRILTELIAELIGIEKVSDDPEVEGWDEETSIRNYLSNKYNTHELLQFCSLLSVLNHIENFQYTPEQDEVAKVNAMVEALQIDLFKIAAEIRKESPHELIQEMDSQS